MAQLSGYWTTGGSTGHRQASYTQAQMGTANKILAASAGYQGVAPGYLNELDGTYTATNTVKISSGGAIVDGKWYLNDSEVTLTIPSATGTGNSRIDLIVLRCNWSGFITEIDIVTGVNASNPTAPSATQQAGSLYEIPLYEALVSRTGVITLTDVRVWASATLPDGSINGNKLASGSVSTDKLADGSVNTSKIVNNSIITEKIINKAVTEAKLDTDSVSTDKIVDGSITKAKLGLMETVVYINCVKATTKLKVENGVMYFTVPKELNGGKLISAHASVIGLGSSGNTVIQVNNWRTGDMLNPKITIAAGAYNSYSHGTPAVSNLSVLNTGDRLRIDVTSVSTNTTGLDVIFVFEK